MNSNLAYREEPWEERIHGQVVMMSPRPSIFHNFTAANIYSIFDRYLIGKSCTPFADGTELYLSEEERYVPDFMLVCDREKLKWNGVHGAPDLVAEVLSPSTARYDRWHKKRVYEAFGVREYWIVNPMDLSVEQHVLEEGHYVLRELCQLLPESILETLSEQERGRLVTEFPCSLYEDLTIRLQEVFKRVII